MKRLLILFLVLGMPLLLSTQVFSDPGIRHGQIQRHEYHLNRLVSLKVVGENLRLNRTAWGLNLGRTDEDCRRRGQAEMNKTGVQVPKNDVQSGDANSKPDRAVVQGQLMAATEIFDQFHSSCRSYGVSTSTSKDNVNKNFTTNTSLRAQFRVRYTDGEFYLRLQEYNDPRQVIDIREWSNGKLQLKINANRDLIKLTLRQEPDGKITLTYANNRSSRSKVENHTIKEDSYFKLMEKHSELMTQKIFPLMQAMGLQIPLSKMDPVVIDAAIALSVPVSGESKNTILRWVRQLNDFDFFKREEASEKLRTLFANYSDTIIEFSKLDWPAEAYSRLSEIISKTPRRAEAQNLAKSMGLDANLDYFLMVLPSVSGERKDRVMKTLRNITGKEFQSVKDWVEWGESR